VALVLAYIVASLFATDRAEAAAETLDLVSYGLIVGLLMILLDTPEWLRRALWAVAMGVGLLAFLAIVQQVTKTYGSTYGGFAEVLPAEDAMRSAGPLNPNPFGQVLVTSAVLAFYLARMHTRTSARAFAAAICAACLVAAIYTQSRAALIALVIAAVVIALLQGVRLRAVALALVAVVVAGVILVFFGIGYALGRLFL
jgi:O-antigen ligase